MQEQNADHEKFNKRMAEEHMRVQNGMRPEKFSVSGLSKPVANKATTWGVIWYLGTCIGYMRIEFWLNYHVFHIGSKPLIWFYFCVFEFSNIILTSTLI